MPPVTPPRIHHPFCVVRLKSGALAGYLGVGPEVGSAVLVSVTGERSTVGEEELGEVVMGPEDVMRAALEKANE